MSARKKIVLCILMLNFFSCLSYAKVNAKTNSLAYDTIARELGWVISERNNCGGYYLEAPFVSTKDESHVVKIRGNEGLLSQRGTSILEGQVTVKRAGQQITANKAYLYRDPVTGKINAIDLIGNVHFREPN